MRVNVTYSLELSEVKTLVEELLLKVEDDLQELENLFLKVQANVKDNNDKDATALIKDCRKHLSSMDHSLYDCGNILTGYQQASLQSEQADEKSFENFKISPLEDVADESG